MHAPRAWNINSIPPIIGTVVEGVCSKHPTGVRRSTWDPQSRVVQLLAFATTECQSHSCPRQYLSLHVELASVARARASFQSPLPSGPFRRLRRGLRPQALRPGLFLNVVAPPPREWGGGGARIFFSLQKYRRTGVVYPSSQRPPSHPPPPRVRTGARGAVYPPPPSSYSISGDSIFLSCIFNSIYFSMKKPALFF